MFGKKTESILRFTIRHSLPGRVRIGCPALRYLSPYQDDISRRLTEIPGFISHKISFVTHNVLLRYDAGIHTIESVQDVIEEVVSDYSLAAFKAERAEKSRLTVNERRLQEEPVSEMATRVGITSTALLYSWLKRHDARPLKSLLGRFLTMPSLTALSLAVPIFKSGFESMMTVRRPNADTLSATAILSSLLAGRDLSALTIIWLADIAELLTAYTMESTRKAIRQMLSVGEDYVWRLNEDGSEIRIPIDQVQPGDQLVVHTGDKISVDGSIVSGEAAVDQASVTGEFMPVSKAGGDGVFAGTVVKSGSLCVKAEKVGDQTAVARIIHMVEEAVYHKAPIQAFADKFSAAFIPVNFVLAGLVYGITRSTTRALNMLIIDYSCGVRLSTATALSAAICTAAKNGILIKGGNYLELLDECDTLILDKTGTLTEGRPQVLSVIPVKAGITERDVMELAAAAEETSNHPMAVAILEKVKRSGWKIPRHDKTRVHIARGIDTRVNGSLVRVGSRRFMEDNQIDTLAAMEDVSRMVARGENILYVSRDKELLGVLGIQDALRENMKKALNRLRMTGMDDIVLLTGDVEQHAEIVAGRMAMDRYKAEAMPEDKAEMVLQLQSRGVPLVMVGDGINDAPALAYANVGIAMGGSRTDVAMEAADITITGDDPLMIPATIRLGKSTMEIIRQNFGISIGVNTLGLALASLGVLPVFWGAVLHNSCTVAVVLNSARLLFYNVKRNR